VHITVYTLFKNIFLGFGPALTSEHMATLVEFRSASSEGSGGTNEEEDTR